MPNGKYVLKSIIFVNDLKLNANNNSINIENTGVYSWNGFRYNSTFDNDFIISEEKNGIYILTDSYKNVIEAHQKEKMTSTKFTMNLLRTKPRNNLADVLNAEYLFAKFIAH